MNTTTPPLRFAASYNAGRITPKLEDAPKSDAELISLVCIDPPDEEALAILVDRHWAPLFARCKVLTSDTEKARDLAQSAWCRLLRNRGGLKPDGNFLA